MAVTINQPGRIKMPIAAETLFLNADKTKTVDEDSPDAAYLLCREGCAISDEDVEKYGVKVQGEAENVSEAGNDASGDLESKTKAELLEIAQECGVDVKPSQTKADIITALQGE
jgi:hypothetical protein